MPPHLRTLESVCGLHSFADERAQLTPHTSAPFNPHRNLRQLTTSTATRPNPASAHPATTASSTNPSPATPKTHFQKMHEGPNPANEHPPSRRARLRPHPRANL